MKKKLIAILLFVPIMVFGQIKGEKSEESFTSESGKTYAVGDNITLKLPSNSDKYAYVYKFKSSLSLGNIVNTVNNARNVANLNTSNIQGIKNGINVAKKVANDKILASSLQSKVVTEKYVEENAMPKKFEGNAYEIKYFKVYTDEETGKQIVHAITKGKGGKVAILIDAAEEKEEI